MKGFASPEGSYKSNTVLAGNRVKALAEYIRKKHDFKPELFTLDNGSEDWEGLKAKVEADRSVPSREAVLAIINSNDEPDKKDARLAALDLSLIHILVWFELVSGMFCISLCIK